MLIKSNVNIMFAFLSNQHNDFFINYSIIKLIFNRKYVYSKHKRIEIEIDYLTFIQFYFFLALIVQFAIFLHFY